MTRFALWAAASRDPRLPVIGIHARTDLVTYQGQGGLAHPLCGSQSSPAPWCLVRATMVA